MSRPGKSRSDAFLGGDPPAASATGTLLRLLAPQREKTRHGQ